MICVSSASPPRGKLQEEDEDTTSALLCITPQALKDNVTHAKCSVKVWGMRELSFLYTCSLNPT